METVTSESIKSGLRIIIQNGRAAESQISSSSIIICVVSIYASIGIVNKLHDTILLIHVRDCDYYCYYYYEYTRYTYAWGL